MPRDDDRSLLDHRPLRDDRSALDDQAICFSRIAQARGIDTDTVFGSAYRSAAGGRLWLTFRLAGPVTSRLGEGTMDAITRASGIVLVALGAQLSVAGLVGLTLSNLHLPH